MAALGMAVNSGARLWGPFKALYDVVDAAIYKRRPNSIHDLELALRKHKPDFISLLKTPAKNNLHREAVKKSTTEGIPVQGEQRSQTFSQQFVTETLILSDLFQLNELAAMELLMAGENQLPNYPGLTRGLVAVILYYDGRRSLVNSLRILLQSREGRTWTLGMPSDLAHLIQTFTSQLVEEGLVNKILDLIRSVSEVTEMDKLQKDRALGPPKHRKQVVELFREIKLSLAECLFCLACQQPLSKGDTLRLIAHLREDNYVTGDDKLDPVTLCLLLTLMYCFDVRILEQEDAAEIAQRLPVISDPTYLMEVHREMVSVTAWAIPGLKATVQFAWAMLLRQLSQYPLAGGVTEPFEDDEALMDQAIEGNVFSFLRSSVVALPEFHQDEFYCRRLHCLVTDLIYHMPLKVKELRNRGDETARIIMAYQVEGQEEPLQRRDLEHMFGLICELYMKDPMNLELSLEFWCPAESAGGQESFYNYRPPPRQVALFKFIRGAGDLLPAPLYIPYINMLAGLASGPQAAQHCFNLLKANGNNSGGSSSMVSWDHIFVSLNQYYASLRRETQSSVDSNMYRAPPARAITPHELEGILSVLKLIRCVADENENCRGALFENQQWGAVIMMFGLVGCSIPSKMKAELLLTLAAMAKTPAIAASIWQTLEVAQVLPTTATSAEQRGGIQIELEEIESRSEEYPMTIAFLELIDRLTDIPIPAGLGAGYRAPGFEPYLDFIITNVFLRFNSRAYKDSAEKWQVSASALEILCKLLQDHEIHEDDFRDTLVDIQGGGIVSANKPPGHTLLLHMLNDSGLLKMVLRVLDETVSMFEQYSKVPGKEYLEKTALLCLRMIETSLEKEAQFEMMIRETGVSIMVAAMDKLLLSINPRSGKADHLVNVAKFVSLNSFLPHQCLSAVRVLYLVCQAAPIQADLVALFTADEVASSRLLQGIVECIETDDREVKPEEAEDENENTKDEIILSQVRNASRQHIIQLMLHALDQPAPNLAHWMLGFEVRKPVSKTNLQDPGILGSARTCLHSVLAFLGQGVGARSGPVCLMEAPRLAELAYNLIYVLCSNKDTSAPTLRYLRTTHNFLYNQLQHLPFREEEYGHPVISHQSWLLKTIAIELRITSLNRQRSHTQRLLRLLLADTDDEQTYVMQPVGTDEGELSTWDRDPSSFLGGHNRSLAVQAQQTRRKLLCILDSISFAQQFPVGLQLDFFDPKLIEQVITSCETKTKTGIVVCDVRNLRRILINELNNQQGTMMAGQRPLIQEEIQNILSTVVARNSVRESLYVKRQSFEAWRQVTEVLLTACPEDVLMGEVRQMVIFEVLQDLLVKVADDDAMPESTGPVAGVILTLMANLRQCFLSDTAPSTSSAAQNTSQYVTMLDRSVLPSAGSAVGSRTLFASSLQMVLKGVLDYILRAGGGAQRVRANLYGALLYYLQIAQKPAAVPQPKGKESEGMSRVLGTKETEYEQLSKENLSTILSYGDSLMETVCRDACDGHDIGRMLALSVLDTVMSIDHYQQWLSFLSKKGYLQHLVDSLLTEDADLQKVLAPSPEQLRSLYIYQSKMSLLTRVGETLEGAHLLLRCGILQKLSACAFFDLRPESESPEKELMEDMSGDEFIPSPMARYRILLFAALNLCLAILTSLGLENKDVAAQVMLFIISHSDVFNTIVRSRKPLLSLSTMRELALTTCVISRANFHTDLGSEYLDSETALIEFRGHRSVIQRQMLSLLSHYSFSPRFSKQLTNLSSQTYQGGQSIAAKVSLAYQEVTSNVVAYCRSLLTESGPTTQYSRILFSPGLEEGNARDLQDADEFSISSIGGSQSLSLGVIVYLLKQCAGQFLVVYDSHRQHVQKLTHLQDLSSEDLKQFSGASGTEKMSSQQRHELARSRLTDIVTQKAKELQHHAYIVENCLFIIWRHLEYYLLHCIPVDQQPLAYQAHMRRHNQIRRLQDLTGIRGVPPAEPEIMIKPEYEQLSHGVTRDDIELLKQTAPSVISESLLKKVQEINQCYVKDRSHYSFTEAVIRRIKRLLRLHTGS
ncbi:nuclear pore complex protein Nup205-like [Haliotis rubra]|uniref:nuclear pore complex protein Nup205-like n=1 Tax=Haliotis rubra TaxID=36100 RepID=UPI001EE58A0F|nr:nuclear pore complex protein Nup205-like [Haliotis rubra]